MVKPIEIPGSSTLALPVRGQLGLYVLEVIDRFRRSAIACLSLPLLLVAHQAAAQSVPVEALIIPVIIALPIVIVFVLLALFFNRRENGRGIALLCVCPVALYALIVALMYLPNVAYGWFDAQQVLILSLVLLLSLQAVLFVILRRARRAVMTAVFVAIVSVNLLTPEIISYVDYEIVQQRPESPHAMEPLTSHLARLQDGRYLHFEEKIPFSLDVAIPVLLEDVSESRFRVSRQLYRYKRARTGWVAQFHWRNVKLNQYELQLIGIGEVRESTWKATDDELLGAIHLRGFCPEEYVVDLLRHGADPNAVEPMGLRRSILHKAAAYGCDQIVPILVEAGADINTTDESGNTPLHVAARSNTAALIAVIDAGADVHMTTRDGRTALDILRGQSGRAGFEEALATLEKAATRSPE